MTFVAEPYLSVTDQVLTALTGGVARETHRFFARANGFAFEVGAERVLVDSIRVIGQAGGTFRSFEAGRDLAVGGDGLLRFLASKDDAAVPAPGATWPDEATEFHVGYYHRDSDRALLTDRNVGSLTRTLAEAFARELAVLRSQLEAVYRSAFVDTAEGRDLDLVVALLGLSRKTRDFPSGAVRFFRDTPAPADVFVPAGTKVSTALPPAPASSSPVPAGGAPASGPASAKQDRPVAFVTSADRTLRRGQLSVEAPIRAEEKGAAGVVDAGAISVINQPVLGISGVTNDAPTVFGGAGESDGELRRRAKTIAERAGRATPGALVNALTELSSIRENDVKVVEELALRPGVVQVFVAADPTPELAVQVQQAILATRAAGIRVEHNLEAFVPQASAAATASGDLRDAGAGADATTPTTASASDDFRYPLCAQVVVFPQNARIVGADKANLEAAIRGAVAASVDASSVGGTLVYNRLSADLMDIPGVLDAVLDLAPRPAEADGPCVGKRNLTLPQGRRAVIDAGADVKVVFAGAPVSFDVAVAVSASHGAGLTDIKAEVRTLLASYFAANPNPVDTTGILAAIGVSNLYTVLADGITWTAEYEQAGLVIHDQGGAGGAASTALAEGDRAVLRDVGVTVAVAVEEAT